MVHLGKGFVSKRRVFVRIGVIVYTLLGATRFLGQATPAIPAPWEPKLPNWNPPIPPVNQMSSVGPAGNTWNPTSWPNGSVNNPGAGPNPNSQPTTEQTRSYINSLPAFQYMPEYQKDAIINSGPGSPLLTGPYLSNGAANPFYQNGWVTPNWYVPATWSSRFNMNWQGVQSNGFLPSSSMNSFYGSSGGSTYNPTTYNNQYSYTNTQTYRPPVQRDYQPNPQYSSRPPSNGLPQRTSFSTTSQPPSFSTASQPPSFSAASQPRAPATFSPSASDRAKLRANGERALALSETAGDKVGQATNHADLAQLLVQQGHPDLALAHVRAAETITGAVEDPSLRVNLLRTKGAAYMASGEFEQAIVSYRQALSNLPPIVADKAEQAEILTNMGWAYQSLGDIPHALKNYQDARDLFAKAGDTDGMVRTTLGIGSVFESIGEPKKAVEQYRSAAPYASDEQFARMLVGNAEMLQSANRQTEALARYDKALAILKDNTNRSIVLPPWAPEVESSNDPSLETSILAGMGRSHMAWGLFAEAQDEFGQARSIAKASGNRVAEAGIIASMGELEYWKAVWGQAPKPECWSTMDGLECAFNKFSLALKNYSEALLLMRAAGNRIGEVGILTNIGLAYDAQGKFREALSYYREALQQMDDLERSARLEEFRIDIAGQSASLYARAIELEAEHHHMEEAFNLSERARARTLLDQLGNARIDFGKNAPPTFAQRESKLRQENISLRRQLGQELSKPAPEVNLERTQSLQARLAAVRKEYEDAVSQLKLSNPEYASFLSIAPLTLRDAQQQLDPDATLLSYFTTPNLTLAFVLTRDSFHTAKLPVTSRQLSSAIATFLDFAGESDDSPALELLYKYLIKPIKGQLKTTKLIVVPHGTLHDLPFAALKPNGKSYLNDHYALAYLPSVSILPYVRSRMKPEAGQALVLANDQEEGVPQLSHANDEARAVASLLETQPLLGADATASTLRARAGDSAIVHLTAHFDLDRDNPQSTRILLGQDQASNEPSDLSYVASLNLRKTNLVVLSGCQTQIGKRSRGDDAIGLTRAFMYAGAPSVVASLWSVDDDATQKLMVAFYTHLNQGLSKAEALRAAQADLRQQYPHPYYWAGFVLTGDPGRAGYSLRASATKQ